VPRASNDGCGCRGQMMSAWGGATVGRLWSRCLTPFGALLCQTVEVRAFQLDLAASGDAALLLPELACGRKTSPGFTTAAATSHRYMRRLRATALRML